MSEPKRRISSVIDCWSTIGSGRRDCGLKWVDSYPSSFGSELDGCFSSVEGERSTTRGGCAATIGCETVQAGGTAAVALVAFTLVASELSFSSGGGVGGSMCLTYL